MKVGAVIQARVSSTRLPEKILLELPFGSGIRVLEQVIRRVKKSSLVNEVIVATTEGKEDDVIVEIAEKEKVKWFRGSKNDVLERYYLACVQNNIDVIVRITSDCPCADWNIIDMVIEKHLKEKADYTSNIVKRSFPRGLDVEVASFSTLERAYREAKKSFEREHVFSYIHTSSPHRFSIASVEAPEDLHMPDVRVTLDTEEDYALLCAVFDYLYPQNPFFTAHELVSLFRQKPWLRLINKKVVQKKIISSLEEEFREAIKLLKLQELPRAAEIIQKALNKLEK